MLVLPAVAQETGNRVAIGFYNLENLFDTIDDPLTNDAQFLPNGDYQWTSERYECKLANMSKVISLVAKEYGNCVAIGVSEVENERVLIDLVNHPNLKPLNSGVVHHDSPDRRGVDVALLYQKDRFTVLDVVPYRLYTDDTSFYTRDQLLVKGLMDGFDTVHIIVNHWPSRFADSYAVFSGDRTGVQERVNLTAPSVPNAASSASYVTPLVITKNPTNEQRYVGETAWFVANATGYNSLYWTLVSPWGQEYSIAEIRSQFPGANISGDGTTTLTINGLFAGLNGWGAYCTFSNGVQSARTTTAYVYVYEKTSGIKNTNSNDYYNWYGLSDEELYDLALIALVLDDSDWALVQDTSYYDPWEDALAEAAWNDYFDMLWDVQDYG